MAEQSDTPTRRRREIGLESNIWKSFVFSFLLDLGLTAPIWVLYYRDERGFSLTQITLLELPIFAMIMFAEVPTGAVADRFGRRVSLMLGSALFAAATFVIGTATSYLVILAANAAWGLAFTLRSGADTALLYDSMKQAGQEGAFQSINSRLQALRSGAMLAGLLLGAPLAAATGFTFVYTLSAVASAVAVLVAFVMHEPLHDSLSVPQHYVRTLVAGVQEAWRKPALRYIFLYSGVLGSGTAGPLLLVLQPWLTQHGIGVASVGVWQAPLVATEVLGALAAGWVLSRLGDRASFFALPATLTLCGVALAGVDSAWIAVAFLGIALVRGLHNPLLAGYINRHIESRNRATVLSAQNLAGSCFMICFWPSAGLLTDAFGLQAVFLMYASAALVFGGVAILLWDGAERQDRACTSAAGLRSEGVPAA